MGEGKDLGVRGGKEKCHNDCAHTITCTLYSVSSHWLRP